MAGGMFAAVIGGIASDLPSDAAGEAEAVGGMIGGIIFATGVVIILLSSIMITSGFGIMQRKQWGRILCLIVGGLAGLGALMSLLSIFAGNLPGIVPVVVDGGYCAYVFVILLKKQYAAEFS